MNNSQYWFYIEPYVHTAMIEPDQILMYNPLNYKHLVFKDKKVFSLVKETLSNKNFGVKKIDQKDLVNLQYFMHSTRENFMTDLISIEHPNKRPVRFITEPVILSENGSLSKEKLGKNVLHNLTHLTVYLNSICKSACELCNEFFKQTLCCHFSQEDFQVDIEFIRKILIEAKESSLLRINITGGNILKYPSLLNLISELNLYEVEKNYIFNIKHLKNDSLLLKKILIDAKNNVEILITSPEDINQAKNINIGALQDHIVWNLFIQSDYDVNVIDKYIQDNFITNCKLTPIYNGKNLSFFEQNIYTNIEDIINEKVSELEFKRNQLLNNFFFGHLIVSASGHVYSNISDRSLGQFPKKSLNQLIYEELLHGNNWLMVRRKLHPCSECLYNCLCQPISTYESAIGKPNLCHVKP